MGNVKIENGEVLTELALPIRRVHIVGIGGAGMSAIAMVLAQRGVAVSGSDLKASAAFERLAGYGVELHLGHDPDNVGDCDMVVISSAIRDNNPEVVKALQVGIPVLDRRAFFPILLEGLEVVGVAGTHGKTTTTSMLTLALLANGLGPSYIIGGELNEAGTSAAYGRGRIFVIEADESDKSFLSLGVFAALVNNLEPDHLESYGSYRSLISAFVEFLQAAKGPKVVGTYLGDYRELLEVQGVVTFGEGTGSDYWISDVLDLPASTTFNLHAPDGSVTPVSLAIPGLHNCLNATGAIAMANQLGVPIEVSARAVAKFAGVTRRFQRRGERDGITYIDDYGHLPSELRAVIATARAQWPSRRIMVVFQPHRYSRTKALFNEFADELAKADLVVVSDVYPAGEDEMPGVSGELIAAALSSRYPDVESLYHPGRSDLAEFCLAISARGDVVISMGAGDITALASEMIELSRLKFGEEAL